MRSGHADAGDALATAFAAASVDLSSALDAARAADGQLKNVVPVLTRVLDRERAALVEYRSARTCAPLPASHDRYVYQLSHWAGHVALLQSLSEVAQRLGLSADEHASIKLMFRDGMYCEGGALPRVCLSKRGTAPIRSDVLAALRVSAVAHGIHDTEIVDLGDPGEDLFSTS